MVALNFTKQFADDVESGKKRCTIRRAGKRLPPKVNDELQLFTGMRTKYCRLLRRGTCTDVTPVTMYKKNGKPIMGLGVVVGREKCWIKMVAAEVRRLALEDGFASEADFFTYFLGEDEEFQGFLIEWEPHHGSQ